MLRVTLEKAAKKVNSFFHFYHIFINDLFTKCEHRHFDLCMVHSSNW